MPERAIPLDQSQSSTKELFARELKDKIFQSHSEEIIIGVCGPIGTDIHSIVTEIGNVIEEKFDYEIIIIRLSEFIKDHKKIKEEDFETKYLYINSLIDKGNELRKEKGSAILAELAIGKIAVQREKQRALASGEYKSHRTCFIIDSIKNPDELDTFRLIYSDLFYFIGVFSNINIREKYLEKSGVSKYDILKLIDRDSGEEINNGQKVNDTFIQADFFLRNDELTSAAIRNKIERYLNLIFNSEIITPTSDETSMYQAFAAAGNSACLSRQVGASITNKNGEIISIGWNDVPKFLGGVYKSSDIDPLGENDKRCLNIDGGICFNDQEKNIISNLLLEDLIREKIIDPAHKLLATSVIKKSRIKELIEFSRAVHAEMHAIIIGGQSNGNDMVGGKLYCTTYPCHNCARHIVAAGIKDVYYIEPYRKSLALKLHDDSISENENDDGKKMRVLMFDGVAPRRYLEFFKMLPNSRKAEGKKKKINKKEVYPKSRVSLQAIPILEKYVVEDLKIKNLIKTSDNEQQE
ncbi:MAG: anti-phage dCTP deaminase [Flavipsychrobacter sp.]|nr:anti-phage dCTP deaminase [Flavipsychrobacter sp.]